MTDKLTECGHVKPLLALRVSEDLNVDEAARVDQHTRYCEGCRKRLIALSESVGVLRELGAGPTPVDDRPSLWEKIEPRLGPAGRFRRRPFSWVSTRQLALACALLIGVTIYLETSRPGGQVAEVNRPGPRVVGEPNQFASQLPEAVIRPMLGVFVQEVNEGLAERLGLPEQQGALVAHVIPASSADLAGLQTADVILAVNGVPIKSPQHLANIIGSSRIGRALRMQILRDGRVIERDVILGAPQSKLEESHDSDLAGETASPSLSSAPFNPKRTRWA